MEKDREERKMKLHRKKNAARGIIFGVILKLYQIIMPFIVRTLVLHFMGIEYVGLNSLFKSLIQVLNIAELGVGSALVFSMYEPIAKNDSDKICALMKLYRTYYRLIGSVILFIGLLITPWLKYLIKGSIPENLNLYIMYFLNLGMTVVSYWLFAYRNSLFLAHQRNDIVSIIELAVSTFKYIFLIFAIAIFKNYYYYLIINIIFQIVINIVTAIFSKKYYPSYYPIGKMKKEEIKAINNKVKDLFASKIGQVFLDSFDTIVISSFLGLTSLAIYQNYFYIISSLIAIFKILFKSLLAGIGNSLVIESEEKNYNDFYKTVYLFKFLGNFSATCLLCLYQVFMKIWVEDNSLLLNTSLVILFVVYFYVYIEMLTLELYKDAAGDWHKDKFRPIIASIVNLGLNLALVKFGGLYAILLSTIISLLFVNLPWILIRLFNDIFKKFSKKDFIKRDIKYIVITIFSITTSYFICSIAKVNSSIIKLLLNLIISTIVSSGIFVLCTKRESEYLYYKNYVKKLILRREE